MMIAPAGEGLPGFSGHDLPLAAGSVTGVRLWHLDVTSVEAMVNGTPVLVDGLLVGVFGGVWRPGENVAECGGGSQGSPPCDRDIVPAPACGCGFWAYWALRYAWRCDYYWHGDVIGVIQGYGRTMIGTRGCRCGKARIVGLHVRPARPDSPLWGLRHQDVLEVLGRCYGVPCYPSLADMLAAHPLTADYLPRRRRRLATSPVLGPAVPALLSPVNWLRAIAGRAPGTPAGSQDTPTMPTYPE
ncbi:MAG TPA: hypothetical protein VGS19_00225 [Streptosporangiaceae bacterium]|nr:hypothetical protein [Streptosporangiaceae bacterium]